jgi:VacB/RNase II family 3'-5' exoribonuclease
VQFAGPDLAELEEKRVVAGSDDLHDVVIPSAAMNRKHEALLIDIARQVMLDKGLLPEFAPAVHAQLNGIEAPAQEHDSGIRDLRHLLWCSIDNDDSLDLDQLTYGEALPDGSTRIFIAVADVDAIVRKGTPIDDHARHNTTSVYTAARIFSMLPEKLSTDFTSLNPNEERLVLVTEMTVREDGTTVDEEIYRALVRNHSKLAYDSLGAWLEGEAEAPADVQANEDLERTLRLQDEAAGRMREVRHAQGALDLETIEARPVLRNGVVVALSQSRQNNAKLLIEDFMIAANGATARFLERHGSASIRRVVRSPERWDRIERIAEELGDRLPPDPDPIALEAFLLRRKKADPLRFPDLSLSIVKAMGAGQYVVEDAGEESIGHFGLAVKDYTHSTAPNRRFPDLITHRLVKAVLESRQPPYPLDELSELAAHCTKQENAANKVERWVRKSAAACLLANRVGDQFDGIVTGASAKGTWARIFQPPIEGKIVRGHKGLDIGDRVKVKLLGVDIEMGHIDFGRTGR